MFVPTNKNVAKVYSAFPIWTTPISTPLPMVDDDNNNNNNNNLSADSSQSPPQPEKKRRTISILLCPAQFCVPDDYDVLWDELKRLQQGQHPAPAPAPSSFNDFEQESITIGTTVVAPLSRNQWLQVSKAALTPEFFSSQLKVHSTLDWYFQAMEEGIAQLFAKDGPDTHICIIGHSIGGWVARAYLGGCSR